MIYNKTPFSRSELGIYPSYRKSGLRRCEEPFPNYVSIRDRLFDLYEI